MRRGSNACSATPVVAPRDTAEDRTSGQFTIGVKYVPPMPPEIGDRMPHAHLLERELPIARLLCGLVQFDRDLRDVLLVRILMTGTSSRDRVHGDANLTYFLITISPCGESSDALNCGKLLHSVASTRTSIAVNVRLRRLGDLIAILLPRSSMPTGRPCRTA